LVQELLFNCYDLGKNELLVWVYDEAGNKNACTVTLDIQDNNNICPGDTTVNIEGRVWNSFNTPMSEVEVFLDTIDQDLSNDSGEYAFNDVAQGDYVLSASYQGDILEDVSTLDLVLIQRHILGLHVIDNPHIRIAADINSDKTISVRDIVALRKVILGIDDTFPDNTAWKVIVDDQLAVDDWRDYREQKLINLQSDTTSDFVAIKIASIDGQIQPRSPRTLDGEVNTSPDGIVLTFDESIIGCQMSLSTDGSFTQLASTGIANIQHSTLALVYTSDVPVSSVYIPVSVQGNLKVTSTLRAEAYSLVEGVVEVHEIKIRTKSISTFKVYPNPVVDRLNIQLPTDENQSVLLQIYDMQGDKVQIDRLSLDRQTLDVSMLAPGVYTIKIGKHTTKFVKLNR
jgi:hypothetical protein